MEQSQGMMCYLFDSPNLTGATQSERDDKNTLLQHTTQMPRRAHRTTIQALQLHSFRRCRYRGLLQTTPQIRPFIGTKQ